MIFDIIKLFNTPKLDNKNKESQTNLELFYQFGKCR